jgi:uncharacterized SAM-binding protein YcdF (DUF218 family)
LTFAPNPPSQRSAASFLGRRIRLSLLIFFAIVFVGIAAFRGAGRWLVRPDTLAHADAIVILSGGMPYRAEEAADLFQRGYAPEVWITHPQSPAEVLQAMGIRFYGEEDYDREILLHSKVPDSSIHILPGTIVDTEQELTQVARELQQEGKSQVIIVTSPEHTRRVRTLWRLLAGKQNLTAIVCDAPLDPFDADHWWKTTRDTFAVVREFMGLFNAWLHFPVRPPSH